MTWGEQGYVRLRKQPWQGGPAGIYWEGIYSASRPIVSASKWVWVHGACWRVGHSKKAMQVLAALCGACIVVGACLHNLSRLLGLPCLL